MRFIDIPKRVRQANYRINISWKFLEETLMDWEVRHKRSCMLGLDMNPEFQRGHVWTEEQQVAYVEFKLSGGIGSNEILFNCTGWMDDFRGPFVLVDGKQRIEAVTRFKRGDIRIFRNLDKRKGKPGFFYHEFSDDFGSLEPCFIFCVNNLESEKDVLKWYLEINTGGTPHTKEEIDKVKKMLQASRRVK